MTWDLLLRFPSSFCCWSYMFSQTFWSREASSAWRHTVYSSASCITPPSECLCSHAVKVMTFCFNATWLLVLYEWNLSCVNFPSSPQSELSTGLWVSIKNIFFQQILCFLCEELLMLRVAIRGRQSQTLVNTQHNTSSCRSSSRGRCWTL